MEQIDFASHIHVEIQTIINHVIKKTNNSAN
jgi:hypothetical protein